MLWVWSVYQSQYSFFWWPALRLSLHNGSTLNAGDCFHVSNPFMTSFIFPLCGQLQFGLSMLVQPPGVALTTGTTWDRKWVGFARTPRENNQLDNHITNGLDPIAAFTTAFVLWMILATTPTFRYLYIFLQPVRTPWSFLVMACILNQRPLAEVWS